MSWLDWFGGDDAWQRPRQPVTRGDVWLPVGIFLMSALTLELARSYADFTGAQRPWVQYLALASVSLLLVWRRRFPLAVFGLAAVHFFVVTTWVGEVGYTMPYQLVFFFTIYSAVAWAPDRRATALAMAGLTVGFFFWLAWDFALGQSIENFRENTRQIDAHGLLAPIPAWILMTALLNVLYICGAMAMGQSAWRQARDRALLAEQASTISAQAAELRDQAVVDERLRIARELHDVVAHHVSVMGIQAAGARRLLQRDPDTAAEALAGVEESSRQAVTQMRGLLGALRGADQANHPTHEPPERGPQPTLADLPELYREFEAAGLRVEHSLVEQPASSAEALPLPVQLSLYRTVQEALTNVARHSTACTASVTVRVQAKGPAGWAEVEILDEGRPRTGTSGSGLGLLGMRERVTSHGGSSEIGPRVTGGYRVRVRLPLGTTPSTSPTRTPTSGATR
ncbi:MULTISPECIES: sensor histidine kinase [unclassified Luteococcus]|uniref:sensor histidine kinase n=1 Tax=unclassified Luteococcus TaxID=2639923 RepID=UPI00313C8BF9